MQRLGRDLVRFKTLFLFLIPHFVLMILFNYAPMFGVMVAFQDYRVSRGFLGSAWVGLKHFRNFFDSVYAMNVVRNTILLNLYSLLWGFWVPIIFAILLCQLRNKKFARTVQTFTYLPYFTSAVVIVSLVHMLLSIDGGPIQTLRTAITGNPPINYLIMPRYFRTMYVSTVIWAGFGAEAIVYIAAITGLDSTLYEAAIVDGANAPRRMWHITLPGIRNAIIILLILNIGRLMNSAFELVFLLQRPLNFEVSDTIATYVYRRSFANIGGLPEFSFSTAIGLFQSVVNVILLGTANALARKFSETSLF
jgi:putative aldouronate transport system permease protein